MCFIDARLQFLDCIVKLFGRVGQLEGSRLIIHIGKDGTSRLSQSGNQNKINLCYSSEMCKAILN